VARQEGSRSIRAVFLGYHLERRHHFHLAQIQLALPRGGDRGSLRGGRGLLAEDGRQPQRIAVGAERGEAQWRDHDVAVLLGQLAQQAAGLVHVAVFVGPGAVQHEDDRQRRLPVPGGRDVDAVGHRLPGRRKDVLAMLIARRACRGRLRGRLETERDDHRAGMHEEASGHVRVIL
jgi:hypothetical protein